MNALPVGIAAIVLLAALVAASPPRLTEAHITGGEYSLQVSSLQVSDDIGGDPFELVLRIDHSFGVSDCASHPEPKPQGCYMGVQWQVNYPEILVDAGPICGGSNCAAITRSPDAPLECSFESDSGTRLLAGCIDIDGDMMSFSGEAFRITMNCLVGGPATIDLGFAPQPTMVFRHDSMREPVHRHGVTVNCLDTDSDGDGLSDSWEQLHACTDFQTIDDAGDPDSDGVASLDEYTEGTSPCDDNTDGDLFSDAYEISKECLSPHQSDSFGDHDADGAATNVEVAAGTDECAPDSDSDGMADGYELNSACLDALVPDSDDDPDVDGVQNVAEAAIGSNPCDADSDDDGCADGEELGADPSTGGDRSPVDAWDFYDAVKDGLIDLTDTLRIISHFGALPSNAGYVSFYDRYAPDESRPWRTAYAADGIDMSDAILNLASFGHACVGPV